jgi:hypothetical protein
MSKIIGFHENQLCERGTTIALYDYAYFNEKLLKNKSIIFYNRNGDNNKEVIKKFEKKFKCYAYNKFSEIDNIIKEENIEYFYNIKYGDRKDGQIVTNCINLIHAVFVVDPHGERYATVSKTLADKYYNIVDYIPHMINLPKHNDNMRKELKLPKNAIVLGRHGGYDSFDVLFVYNTIKLFLESNKNIYFIFVNTKVFYDHPRIIYLPKIIDLYQKVKFINTCDEMIHASKFGETFGLAVAEFSYLNKPIITNKSKHTNTHIEILGNKAIIYNNQDELMKILLNIKEIIKSRNDWNAYHDYTPDKVMKQFKKVYLE